MGVGIPPDEVTRNTSQVEFLDLGLAYVKCPRDAGVEVLVGLVEPALDVGTGKPGLVGAADALRAWSAPTSFLPFRALQEYERARVAVREGVGDAAFASASARGAALTFDEVLALAESALT